MVGVDWYNSSGSNLSAYLLSQLDDCPLAADIEVKTFEWTADTNSALSDDVGFTVLVP